MYTLKKHPLAIAVTTLAIFGLSNTTQTQENIPKSPFASTPLNLQNTTTIESGNLPPANMMLLLDDSGSMNSELGNSTRIEILKSVLNQILDKYPGDQFHWNIQTLNGTEGSRRDPGFLNAEGIKPVVQNIGPGQGQTPMTARYLEAVQKLMDATQYRCQKNYMVVMSDGETNQHPNIVRIYRNHGNRYLNYFKFYNYWAVDNLWRKLRLNERYYKYGNLYYNYYYGWANPYEGANIYSFGEYGAGISYYSETAFHHDFSDYLISKTDAEGRSWDDAGDDPNNPMDKQTVTTYTIGFGGVNNQTEACRYLRNAASIDPRSSANAPSDIRDEPACPDNNKGRFFFTADNEEELLEAFDSAISNAAEAQTKLGEGINTISTSTPSTAGSKIPELAAYFSLDTQKWSSVLYFNAINEATGEIDTTSSKSARFPRTRKIIVNTGSENKWIEDTSNTFYGIKSQVELEKGLIPWLRRPADKSDQAIESEVASELPTSNERTVKSYRVRTEEAADLARQMSDVIGSPTISVGKDASGKDKYIITAANDGLVYIFKRTDDDNNPYELALNYLPGAMQRESSDQSDTVAKALRAVAERGYGRTSTKPHLYLNDGGIVYRTTPSTAGAGKQSFIVGAMGKGGRGVYALNIGGHDRIDPSTEVALDAPVISKQQLIRDIPLWETEKGTENRLGYTVGTPQIGQIATQWTAATEDTPAKPNMDSGVRLFAFLGNGYPTNPTNTSSPTLEEQPTLYVYEALGQEVGLSGAQVTGDTPGTLIEKISVSNGLGGLASPTLVDSNFDGIVDTAYAGDYAGNMYRFNLKGAPSDWSVVKIYQGRNTGSSNAPEYTQPITAAPAVYRRSDDDYVVIFGTGSDLYQEDLDNTDQQEIIGIFDDLSKPENEMETVNYNDLAVQEITTIEDRRYLSNNAITDDHKGWRIALTGGERVVVKPAMLLSTAFLTTRNYHAEKTGGDDNQQPNTPTYSCEATTEVTTVTTGQSWLMAINASTGGYPSKGNSATFANSAEPENSAPEGSVLSGLKTSGLSSAAVLYDKQSNTLYSTTKDGDAGGNGLGDKLTGRTNPKNNRCLDSDGYNALYSDESGPQNVAINGPLCPASITRVNYREVPL